MKNVLILTDLEGISSVSDIEAITGPESEDGIRARESLMRDTNTAVSACFDAGAERVYVIDGHGRGENFLPGLLDERAKQISISELTDVVKGLSCAVLIGMHAKAGTMNAFLDHTQSSLKIHRYFYNGKEIGEMAQIGGYLGHFGVACVAVSGDAAACREARELFGDEIFTAEVKTAKCRNLAECLPQDEASLRIYGAVFDGVSNPEKNKPLKLSLPLKITVEFNRADYCEDACRSESVKRIDAFCCESVKQKIIDYQDCLL